MSSYLEELKAVASRKYTPDEIYLFLHNEQRREDEPPPAEVAAPVVLGRFRLIPMKLTAVDIANMVLKKTGDKNGPGKTP